MRDVRETFLRDERCFEDAEPLGWTLEEEPLLSVTLDETSCGEVLFIAVRRCCREDADAFLALEPANDPGDFDISRPFEAKIDGWDLVEAEP